MAPVEIVLRDYQRECVDICDSLESGSHLVQMATGLGKTVTFSKIASFASRGAGYPAG